MDHPLDSKIDAVRRLASRQALIYGICHATVVLLLATFVAGALDYFLRVEYRPARLLLSFGVLLATGWGIHRYLLPQLMSTASDVAIAERIQQRFPILHGKVASAVEFLKQNEDDQLAGSPALRRAVVVEALGDVDQLQLDEVIDRKPARHALLFAAVAILVVGLVVMLDRVGAQIAVARMINPLGNNSWPKVNQLIFVSPPRRLASGSLFEVELRDENGRLPDEVWIDYRFDEDTGPRVVTEAMQFVDGIMVATRDNVRRPFAYRARGGDDQGMPWHELEVIEPPRVASLDVSLQPPAYSGWPPSKSAGRIVGLTGTRIQAIAHTSKQIRSATLVTEGGLRLPAEVHADGLGFNIGHDDAHLWRIDSSDTYVFELIDNEQIKGGAEDQWQIRAIADEPPTVSIEKPPAEIHVAPQATVPVRVLAKDRLAVWDVALKYIRSDASDKGEQAIVLFQGPEQVEPIAAATQAAALADGDRRIVEYTWELAPLGLAPGTQITYSASARDYQPAEGKSTAQRIFVITNRELEDRLARRQASILGDLARVVKAQKNARARAGELEIQLREVGALTPDDLHQLQGLELAQRDVRHALTGENDGILKQIAGLLEDVNNNKLDSPDMTRQLEGLSQLIRHLDKQDLAAIESDLTRAEKNALVDAARNDAGKEKDADQPRQDGEQPAAKAKGKSREALDNITSAGQHQENVARALEQTLGDLQRWDNYRQFARQLASLEDAQRKVRRETDAMRPQTLGRDPKDLTPQQRVDLAKLAARQQELARNFDKLMEGMRRTSQNLQESDPLAADAIADAAHHAGQKGIGNQMRSAGSNIGSNQVEQATARQDAVAKQLQEMLDILANRREQELARLVKKLREAEEELRQLREQQAGLRKKMKEAAQNPDEQQRRRELQRLTKQQRKLQEDAQRLARQLKRLQAQRASSKLARAGSRMGQSGQSGEAGDGAAAAEQAEQAEQDLEQAQQRLAEARRQAEADLAMEQLARLKDQIKAVADRQQGMLDETQRLEQLRADQGRLSRGQLVSVSELARQQMALNDETGQMAKKLTEAKVFELALDRAAAEMLQAAEQLERLDTGDAAQHAERRALAGLDMLIEALADDKGPNKNGGQQGGGAGQGGQQGGSKTRSLSEIKLAKLMQEDLKARTEQNLQAIKQRLTQGGDVADLMQRRAGLADEQSKLADILFDFVKSSDPAPEDDPDKLPGVGEPDEGDALPLDDPFPQGDTLPQDEADPGL